MPLARARRRPAAARCRRRVERHEAGEVARGCRSAARVSRGSVSVVARRPRSRRKRRTERSKTRPRRAVVIPVGGLPAVDVGDGELELERERLRCGRAPAPRRSGRPSRSMPCSATAVVPAARGWSARSPRRASPGWSRGPPAVGWPRRDHLRDHPAGAADPGAGRCCDRALPRRLELWDEDDLRVPLEGLWVLFVLLGHVLGYASSGWLALAGTAASAPARARSSARCSAPP